MTRTTTTYRARLNTGAVRHHTSLLNCQLWAETHRSGPDFCIVQDNKSGQVVAMLVKSGRGAQASWDLVPTDTLALEHPLLGGSLQAAL